ncbi:hypothetical protein LTR17_020408 [Elasticomyces elasticus]|nr:hypothetical protein LTR17_020408 [Elasticomyces elasticus]
MKFFTCTLLALAGLAALSTAAPTSSKKEQIKDLCELRGLGSQGYVTFDAHGRPDILAKIDQVCDGDRLKPGLHLKGDHIEGPIHYRYGDKYNVDYFGDYYSGK